MASGLPVVATDVGGCREMIVNRNNGYVVPPSDPEAMAGRILDLATWSDRDQIGRNSSLKARALFSCESMVTAFERLYAERRMQ
jgi:glycosyltransferase involved in cell wall biosynthesis